MLVGDKVVVAGIAPAVDPGTATQQQQISEDAVLTWGNSVIMQTSACHLIHVQSANVHAANTMQAYLLEHWQRGTLAAPLAQDSSLDHCHECTDP